MYLPARYSALAWAAHAGHAEIVTLLGKYGADTWCISGLQRNTALMRAAKAGHRGVVRALLGLEVDTSIVNANGRTAYDLASDAEIRDMLAAADAR